MDTENERQRLARAARLYPTSKAAAAALGLHPVSFTRLCRRYGIATPASRSAARLRMTDETALSA